MRQSIAGFVPAASRTAIAAACSLVLLAGCDKQPEGQVAAVMNGQEITLQELNLALAGADTSNPETTKVIRQAALQNIINRKLGADLARQEGIDETPEYIVREQQVKDGLLMQMLAQKLGRALKQPTPEQVNQFIAENPNIFEKRMVMLCDQIRFPASQDSGLEAGLRAAKTMDQVTALLDSKGIRYERGDVQIDTAKLPLAMANQIQSLPAGEPFVVPTPAMISVNMVKASKPVPISGDAAKPVALAAYQQQALNKELEKRMKAARDKAKIDYQKGLEPPKSAAAGTAPAAGGATGKP